MQRLPGLFIPGSLYLNGNNTYSGGTTFGSGFTPFVYYNNNNAFGTGPIKVISSAAAPLFSNGGTVSTPLTITLANAFDSTGASGSFAGFNFVNDSYTSVIITGNFTMGANAGMIKNNGDSTTGPLTIKGNISSSGTVTFAGNNGGKIYVSGVNPGLTGTVAIGASLVSLSATNTLSAAAKVSMVNGTLDLGGLTHNMGSTTLVLGASGVSTMDFESGGSAHFANSSSAAWTAGGILNLANYDNQLYIGTDTTGLTPGQLADIEFNGTDLGKAQILSNGEIVDAPEPTSIALGLAGGLGMMWSVRRRKA